MVTILGNLKSQRITEKCINCSADPNPTNGEIELRIEGLNGSPVRFKLFNMEGKVLKSHTVNSATTRLFIGNCEDGPYFIKIMNGDSSSNIIKIIKSC